MAFNHNVGHFLRSGLYNHLVRHGIHYKAKDWRKIRPMILRRIKKRAGDYPVKSMIPLAKEVILAREALIGGVSSLLRVIPVKSCKHCREVYVGAKGHEITTCYNSKPASKIAPHIWVDGCIDDILVPVEAFHLNSMFQNVIKHDQRFDFDRVPAVLELCYQAGVALSDGMLSRRSHGPPISDACDSLKSSLLPEEVKLVADATLEAWERVRLGVQKLLLVYPTKVCQHCNEVHVGPSGHKARVCGMFKFEQWRGHHMWKKATVNDLIPPKIVWHQRPQDPPVLVNSGREFYGHAPAVIELCLRAGSSIPRKYHCMMKLHGTSQQQDMPVLQHSLRI